MMPRLAAKPVSAAGWVLLAVIVAALLAALWQRPLVTGSLLLLVVAVSAGNEALVRRHLRLLAAERTGEDIGAFARQANCRENDSWVVRAVYEQLQNWLKPQVEGFPLRWDDRLDEDLKIDEEDVAETIASEVAERTGRSLEATSANPLFGRVRTVGDLVRFFNAQPRRSEA